MPTKRNKIYFILKDVLIGLKLFFSLPFFSSTTVKQSFNCTALPKGQREVRKNRSKGICFKNRVSVSRSVDSSARLVTIMLQRPHLWVYVFVLKSVLLISRNFKKVEINK